MGAHFNLLPECSPSETSTSQEDIPTAKIVPARRVHIVGGPGSGKSTLAYMLAARLDEPVYDLDKVAYEGGVGPKRSLEARLAEVARISAEPSWVTEGIYLWWINDLLREADVIIWFDVPWRVAAWRIVRRHIKKSLAGDNPYRGVRRLLAFVLASRRYYTAPMSAKPVAADDDGAITRAATVLELQRYKGKVIGCRSRGEALSAIRSLILSGTDSSLRSE
jgi:hypothetical protein